MSNQNGKGSKCRPVNKKEYDKNYDSIFRKKKNPLKSEKGYTH